MDEQKLKTKVRRLYDIANVFLALGLVAKTNMPNKKPGFMWMGNTGLMRTITLLRHRALQLKEDQEKVSSLLGKKNFYVPIAKPSGNKFNMHSQSYQRLIMTPQTQTPKSLVFRKIQASAFSVCTQDQLMRMRAKEQQAFKENIDPSQDFNTPCKVSGLTSQTRCIQKREPSTWQSVREFGQEENQSVFS